ncbi:MAG: polysaccharide deacetylase family protein [Actinomycetota bacterium]|nr:polysaccharide deacetylase family protein [Actinomycetota bacterium]
MTVRVSSLVAAVVLAAACGVGGGDNSAGGGDKAPPVAGAPGSDEAAGALAEPSAPQLSEEELRRLRVNELGRVLVMEWHDVEGVDGRWETSQATFRAQIEELYDRGYRPVTVEEFATGTFPIPAGTSPVVLTFDDSYESHFRLGPDGQPAPNSVVGILEEFERSHPDWRGTAAFYIYWPVPFRVKEQIPDKLRWLAENGYEIGNHSLNHDDLSKLDDRGVQRSLALAQAEVEKVVPGYRLGSLALPFGLWPKNKSLAVDGSFEGVSYHHDVVLLVGFMPTRSPHHAEYKPMEVQRVQAYAPEFRKWVDSLEGPRSGRFVSDGDPDLVTYPAALQSVAKPLGGRPTRVYTDPTSQKTATPTSQKTATP